MTQFDKADSKDELILVVEDSFELTNLGLTFTPNVGLDVERGVFDARVVRPDGTDINVEITIELAHFDPGGYHGVVRARGSAKSDIPSGSEIWRRH